MSLKLMRTLIAALSVGCPLAASAADHTQETLSQVKAAVEQKKGVLVDVREKPEWNSGHIEGAIPLPISTVVDGLTQEELSVLPKSKILYVHCVVGKRALTVGSTLEKLGYQVKVLKPGYRELLAEGFPKAEQ